MSAPVIDAAQRRQRILAQVRAVPSGQVASYGAIARRAGFPRCARLVARILATSDESDLPWHRILRADGHLGLSPASPEYRLQCARLAAEGVEVVKGKVQLRNEEDDWLDAVLWGDADP